jgi:hypothetical protein
MKTRRRRTLGEIISKYQYHIAIAVILAILLGVGFTQEKPLLKIVSIIITIFIFSILVYVIYHLRFGKYKPGTGIKTTFTITYDEDKNSDDYIKDLAFVRDKIPYDYVVANVSRIKSGKYVTVVIEYWEEKKKDNQLSMQQS